MLAALSFFPEIWEKIRENMTTKKIFTYSLPDVVDLVFTHARKSLGELSISAHQPGYSDQLIDRVFIRMAKGNWIDSPTFMPFYPLVVFEKDYLTKLIKMDISKKEKLNEDELHVNFKAEAVEVTYCLSEK